MNHSLSIPFGLASLTSNLTVESNSNLLLPSRCCVHLLNLVQLSDHQISRGSNYKIATGDRSKEAIIHHRVSERLENFILQGHWALDQVTRSMADLELDGNYVELQSKEPTRPTSSEPPWRTSLLPGHSQ